MGFLTDMFCGITAAVQTHMNAGVKSAERHVKRLFIWFAMLSFCVGLLLVGVAFVLWGAYALLAVTMNNGLAALIVGIVVSLIAGMLVVEMRNSVR